MCESPRAHGSRDIPSSGISTSSSKRPAFEVGGSSAFRSCRARDARRRMPLRGAHPDRAVRRARRQRAPALLVGGRASGARAHEARPPAASVPRKVRPAARRSAPWTLRACRWARARSLRGLRDDARAGARVRLRRGRYRHRRVQLPAHAGEDRALRPLRAREGAARRGGEAGVARAGRRTHPRATFASGTRRGPPPSSWPSAPSWRATAIPTSSASSSPAPRDRLD